MADEIRIMSRANRRVSEVLCLRRQPERRRKGLFLAEGVREVTRAFEAGLAVRQVYACPGLLRTESVPIRAWLSRLPATERFEVTEPVMQKLAYRQDPEGILAVVEQPQWRLEAMGPVVGPDLWLIAVGLTKPGNLGAMARTAAAAGASGLLLADSVVDAFNPNAIRASTCAVFSLPIARASTEAVLGFIRRRSAVIVAADPSADEPYTCVDLTGPVALVIGAEDVGLQGPWRRADGGRRVSIPVARGTVDSLNAGVAAAVLLFEAVRQRSPRD